MKIQALEEMLNLLFQNSEQPLTNTNELYHKKQILLLKFLCFLPKHTETVSGTERVLCCSPNPLCNEIIDM